jgi:hypothetical protein
MGSPQTHTVRAWDLAKVETNELRDICELPGAATQSKVFESM